MVETKQNLDETFASFIGNAAALEAIKVEIEGSRRRGIPLRHGLLAGYPGTGKTTLANLIACAFDATFLDINCGRLAAVPGLTLEKILFSGQAVEFEKPTDEKFHLRVKPIIIFWDEAHALPRAFQDELLKPMLDKVYELADGSKVDMRMVTHLFATTDPDKLLTPLKDRCGLRVFLERYTIEELARIVSCLYVEDQIENNGQMENEWFKIEFDEEICAEIAACARQTPRIAKDTLAEGFYTYLRSRTNNVEEAMELASIDTLRDFLRIQGIREYGLNRKDIEYLTILVRSTRAMGAKAIAKLMQVSESDVTQDIEPFLTHLGFIMMGAKGREITPLGRRYIQGVMATPSN